MHGRDDKPIAATAIVVAVVLAVGALIRVVGRYEPEHRALTSSNFATIVAMTGK